MRTDGPIGITISTKTGERIGRLNWQFGCRLHRVWFGDHRGGWSGINFHLCFLWWDWRVCVLRWQTPRVIQEPVLTLRQQLQETHGNSPEDPNGQESNEEDRPEETGTEA